ncbi:hypothetical protein D3C77_381290 [compost metagenome]
MHIKLPIIGSVFCCSFLLAHIARVGKGSLSLVGAALLVAGCAYNPDIRLEQNHIGGLTSKDHQAYIACIKRDIKNGTQAFTVEDSGKVNLFIGSADPATATGLVEVLKINGRGVYSVYQRHAWADKGKLINVAQRCSRD